MILCCGEALIDMLPEGEAFRPHPGGAVFNTAVALGRLGAPAGFFAQLSSDMFGERLSDALTASKVDATLCPRSPQPTTLAFVRLTDGQAEYLFYDEASAGRTLAPADLPALPDGVTALHFGAISLIPEPCGSAFEALCLREAGARVVSLDPNIRANFIADAPAHRARIRRMMAAADIIKVSDEDMAWIADDADADEDAFAGRCLADGASLVVVTRGARGASGHARTGKAHVEATPVTVADTVGAGDTFDAGLLHALDRAGRLSKAGLADLATNEVRDALAFAARAAAVTVSRPGADSPWAHELEATDVV